MSFRANYSRVKLVHVLRLDADTGVRNRDEHMTGFVLLRSNQQVARPVGDRCHGLI
jgi:hypothetical protein